MSEFEGKSVVVTGGASGIGAVIVREFHSAGARVTILDLDPQRAAALATELGPNAFSGSIDVRERASVESAMNAAIADRGALISCVPMLAYRPCSARST